MASITITYTALVPAPVRSSEICATFVPTNAACDNIAAFDDDSYYNTNVYGFGEGMKLEQFMAEQIAHPGIVAALRAAVYAEDKTYTIADATAEDVLYFGEMKNALAEQGFEIEVA